jgi:hypothetical protein
MICTYLGWYGTGSEYYFPELWVSFKWRTAHTRGYTPCSSSVSGSIDCDDRANNWSRTWRRDLVIPRKVLLAHGHQWSLHFQIFENFKTQHFYGSKNYGFKYIKRYMQEEHTQKFLLKNTLYFSKYKKDKSLTKIYIILLLLYYYLLSEICLFYIS